MAHVIADARLLTKAGLIVVRDCLPKERVYSVIIAYQVSRQPDMQVLISCYPSEMFSPHLWEKMGTSFFFNLLFSGCLGGSVG